MRFGQWLTDLIRNDAVAGLRQLRKNKVASAAAILSLALAIGACTSAFRLIDGLLLRPMPVANPERLKVVAFEGPGVDGQLMVYDSCSYPMFIRMRQAVSGKAELIAVSYDDHADLTYGADVEMEKAHLQFVSGRLFPQFGLRPALGRLLTEADDTAVGAHPYAVLSYDYWAHRFGSDPSVIGRTFHMSENLYQVVGVAQEGFTGTETGTVTDVFLPISMKNPRTLASSDNFWLRTFVKLNPGVSVEPIRDRLIETFHQIQLERAKGFTDMPRARLELFFKERLLLEPAAAGRSNLQRDYRRPLGILAVLVGLVLLIACANVANLMMARAGSRAREMAVRLSIGAARWRLVQLLLVESAWLASIATALGALFAWWAAPFVAGMINPPGDPARLPLSADWRVLAFGMLLAVGATFTFGASAALKASAVKPASALKGGDDPHSRGRLMHLLIATQVAFCFLVLFVAGLFVETFDRLSNRDTGYSSEGVLNLETKSTAPQPAAFWDEVRENLNRVPGVERVAITTWPMMSGEGATGNIAISGGPVNEVFSDFLAVSPGWFGTMKVPVIAGRDFRPDDVAPSVVVVNSAFAKQYFNRLDPTGRVFERMGPAGKRIPLRIIGLVRDARSRDNMRLPIRPTVYTPVQTADASGAAQPRNRDTFVVRASGADPMALASVLRATVSRTRPQFRVDNIRTQVEINQARMVRERLLAVLALFFACVALVLAGVGLYGVLDYSALQRGREIGIRIAVGARAGDIVRTVTVRVFVAILTGAAGGLIVGLASVRYLESLLFGVKAGDPITLLAPGLGILLIAALAAVTPVLRAIRINPVNMLRADH